MENTFEMEEACDKTFTEFLKVEGDKSSIWYYFFRAKNGQTAKCKDDSCNQILKTGGGSTSGLHVHLRSKHHTVLKSKPTNLEKQTDQNPGMLYLTIYIL